MHPGLELVGEMKRLRRAPEPTSAMEPWLQKAVHDKLLIEKSTRVRSSDGSKVAKAVGYTCAKDSCGMLFPLGVSKQQYNRHLRDAAAHRTSNFAFGTSVPARSAASSSSNGQRPAEFRPRPSPAQIFATLNAKAAAAVAAKAASAAEDSNQAERALAPLHAAAAAAVCAKATDAAEESRRAELARAPLHAAAATAVTVAAVRQEACRDAEERVMSTLVRPQSLTLSAARVAEATQQLVSVRQLAQLDARHFGQCAAEELARVQDHAKLDSAEFARRTANDMASVQRAAELDKERLRELHAARARAEKAEFAAMAGKVEQRAADARRVHAEVRLDLVEAQSAAMQSAAKAALMDAEQRARQLNTELAAALLALHDYRTMLAPEICAVGWAYAEGKLSDFEVALLKQLGKASSGAIGREGHDSLVTAVLGLVATGSAMDGAKLLHERAPHLFPSETKLRDEYRKEPRPPMLLRDLTGLSGETLDDALREAKAHFTRAGYDGPVVFVHTTRPLSSPSLSAARWSTSEAKRWSSSIASRKARCGCPTHRTAPSSLRRC